MSDRFATAGQWLLKLQSDDLAPEEFASWLAWYEADPLNRAAFDEAREIYDEASGLPVEDRARMARNLIAKPSRFEWRQWWPGPASFAAGALAVAAAGLLWFELPQRSQ